MRPRAPRPSIGAAGPRITPRFQAWLSPDTAVSAAPFDLIGPAENFNTDQGSQVTSFAFTSTLEDAGIRISMDGRGRWMDNVFIERLWRSLKHECVFLNAFKPAARQGAGIGRWIGGFQNAVRPHSPFDGRTPDEVYAIDSKQEKFGGVVKPGIHPGQTATLPRKADPPQSTQVTGYADAAGAD